MGAACQRVNDLSRAREREREREKRKKRGGLWRNTWETCVFEPKGGTNLFFSVVGACANVLTSP